jgi:surfeit locus 1 family protein
MKGSTRQFRAQAIPTIIMVILTPLFCALGLWQLDRAEQKRSLATNLELRRKQPALSLNQALPMTDELEFRKIVAQGHYLADKTILIENRKHLGKTGFHVITPLKLSDSGKVVLVNRGWVPLAQLEQGEALPTPAGEVIIHGTINLPQPPAIELGLSDTPSEGAPHWPYLTLEHFSHWSGQQILPFAVLQSPQDAEGFIRQWPTPQISDAMHIGYAIQWFAFALITWMIWLRLSLRTPPAEVKTR